MKIFEFAAILTEHHKDKDDTHKLIVEPTTVLAKDDKQATMLAARAIPQEHADKLADIEIAVRPF